MNGLKKNSSIIAALTASFSVAMTFIILGAISVELIASIGINQSQFGTLVFGFFLSCCIIQLFVGPLVDSVGFKPVAILGFIITAVSLTLLSFATSFSFALFACILMGIGAMSLSTVGTTLATVVMFDGRDPARAINFVNGFFGLGYILTPLLVVFMLNSLNMNYNSSLIVLSILMVVFMIVALSAGFPKVTIGFKFKTAFSLLFKPAIIIAALALFCYISLEVTMGAWIRSLMNELYAGSTAGSASSNFSGVVLSFFGVAMMVGRFASASIKNLTRIGTRLIIIMSIVSLGAIILMVVANSPAIAMFAVIIAGLAFAPIFPTIVGITFSKFEPGLYGSIFGIIFSIGLLGGTFIPNIIGKFSEGATVQQGLMIAGIMAFILVIISLFIGRVGTTVAVKNEVS